MEIEKWLAFIHKDEQTLYREVIQNASEREMSGSFDYRMNTALGEEYHNIAGTGLFTGVSVVQTEKF